MENGIGKKNGNIDCLDGTELRLGLPGGNEPKTPWVNKRSLSGESKGSSTDSVHGNDRDTTPPAKAQVVGWPPVRSYRRNNLAAKKKEESGRFIKVSMDGAPYLRKIDPKVYEGYKELREALENMFKNFSLGDLLEMGGYDRCEYDITYEDKDGDWMLVGDVPWEMFISSCKRLRIMRGSGMDKY
ncbi:uncharacterized protein A4U43_C08F20420 [Asparagus officinalis]|uniref:auxin-induced protein 22D-like n=1 Tax=Asparagus officinalis TaxID=4686 RepID=UPI00098E1570|nr:auxin-induced protein 22D-like [Asparagus officinalis]ONK60609.1 uncharacterized protein A4U43_C08F20420 [Asparagus officinalis]